MAFYGEEAERIFGETIPNRSNDYLSVVAKEPIGPVAAITPWNYPVELLGWKLGGALGAGCTMVIKPSEYTPGAAQIVMECIRDAGFPPGVVNVVYGAGEVGAMLAGHPDIAKLAFTGSNATGQKLFSTVQGVTRLTDGAGRQLPVAGVEARRPRPRGCGCGPAGFSQRRPDLYSREPHLCRGAGL